MGGSALEDHVLEEVGHAGFAVAFVPRADQDGQVDGDLGSGRVGEQEDTEAVFEPIFRDSLDRCDLPRRRRIGCGLTAPNAASASKPGIILRSCRFIRALRLVNKS